MTLRGQYLAAPILIGLIFLTACAGERPEVGTPEPASSQGVDDSSADGIFTDLAQESGIDFVQFNGMTGEYYFPEINGSGVALFDYDNDGDLDAYLVQGNFIDEGRSAEEAVYPPSEPMPLLDRLYRNDLKFDDDGRPLLRFTDVTEQSGIVSTGYGMGVAAADYNNDGWVDLYVTNVGPNLLLRNNGDGTFSDETAAAGVKDRRWSIAAVFFDYDRDGWLDLYCGNYVDFNLGNHKVCRTDLGEPDWCGPLSFRPEPDSLFHNRGDGTFEDVTARAGLSGEYGNGMGATSADFNGDGWLDLYVANDGVPNQMWINQRDGTFLNDAMLGGTAVNEDGEPEASMGIDVADFDDDGDEDLFLAHLAQETNTIYLNDGQGFFDDVSVETGLAMPSWEGTGFGTSWIDFDNDGYLDIMVVNGAVRKLEAQVREKHPYPLAQANQLYRNRGDGTFEEVTNRAGATFSLMEVSRGVGFGDLDNDGDTDALMINNSGPARLLINTIGQDRPWIGIRALRADTKLDALGARVAVVYDDGGTVWRRVKVSGSYGSSKDPRILVGLRGGKRVASVEIHWPLGEREEFSEVQVGRYNSLTQGSGEPLP